MPERRKCKYIFQSGKKKGEQCGVKASRPTGVPTHCAKHFKSTSDRVKRERTVLKILQDDPILNANIPTDKPPVTFPRKRITKFTKIEDKSRFSVWMVTINSQKDVRNMLEREKQKFRNWCDFLFHSSSLQIVNFIEDERSPDDVTANIIKVQAQYNFETGKNAGKLHCHAVVRMEHVGIMMMKPNKLRAVSEKIFGYKLHYRTNVSSDPVAQMELYIEKQQE